jgi:acyl-CoA reductase-like NAD-dependent aldehyde dehydrogenase
MQHPGRATTRGGLDRALDELQARSDDWVHVGSEERAGLLRACLDGVGRIASEWVDRTRRSQRIPGGSTAAGEPWLSGPTVAARCVRTMATALERGGALPPAALTQRDDQWIAKVVPANLLESIVFRGLEAELWIESGAPAGQGALYRDKADGHFGGGGVALVLGAGNVSSIAIGDVVHKLFASDEVVILKMHPVNDYLGPLFEEAFAPLIDRGYLRIVYGGADVGESLCGDDRVHSIHLTGSDRTYDAIVWGADTEEQARRKDAGEPLLAKPVTAELGCVTPVLVTPGAWSESDLDYQARSVAGMVVNNASFNCNAAKVLVLARGWPQREAFLARLRTVLARTPQRYAYYPGAENRYASFVERYPAAERLGPQPEPGYLPWTVIPDVPPESGEYALSREAFCGVLALMEVEATGAEEFLERAVDLANERIWGSLTAMLLVDDATRGRIPDRVEAAVRRLRYGGVALNCWSGYLFGLATTSWGAYPGNRSEAVGSGIGTVGNTLLFEHPEKSVVRSGFRAWPKPVWFPDHRNLEAVGRHLLRFELRPGPSRLAPLVLAAIRG